MTHINYLYDFTITVFIVNTKKQVLLVNHPRYQKWVPIGGHIEMNEDPEEALYREISEETGLDVRIISNRPKIESKGTKFLPSPNYLDVHEANLPHKHISLTYFAFSPSDKFVMSSEHQAMRWFSLGDIDKPEYDLSSAVKFYFKEAIKAVTNSKN